MKRANLLLTDQSSSGSKMTTTGLSTPSGSTRTKAAKGLFSHFMFLASLLLIALLTSGKALADDTYTITPGANTTVTTPKGGTQEKSVKTFTLTADAGYVLPADLGTIRMNGETDLTKVDNDTEGDTYQYNPENGEVTINAAAITGDIVITATALSTDATLSALKYTLEGNQATDVSGFVSTTPTYNVALKAYTTAATVTLSGTPATGATITESAAAAITKQDDGTQKATATITVTAEDQKTTQTYTVNFTSPRDELATVTTPTADPLSKRMVDADAAVAELNTRGITTAIITASGAVNDPQDVTWSFDETTNSGDYKTAAGKSNKFVWTIDLPETLANKAGTPLTGNIDIDNVAAATGNALTALTYKLPNGQATNVKDDVESDTDTPVTYSVSLINGTEDGTVITVAATASEYATINGEAGGFSGTATLSGGAAQLVLTVTSESGEARTVTINFTVDAEESITAIDEIVNQTLPQAVTKSEDVITWLGANVTPEITSTGDSDFKLQWEYKKESNGNSAFNPASAVTNVFDWKVVNAENDMDAKGAAGVDVAGKITVTNHTVSTDATLETLQYKIGDGAAEDIAIGNQTEATVAIAVPALPFGTTAITLLATATDPFANVVKVEEPTAASEPLEAKTFSFPVTISADGTTFKLKVTAEDESTKTFTLTFSVAKEKITGVTVPKTYKLPAVAADVATAITLLEKMEGVTITTDGEATMKLKWQYNNDDNSGQAYDKAGGKTNVFAWSVIRDGEGDALEGALGVTITGKTTVTNLSVITGDQPEEDVKVTTDNPIDKIGDGSISTTVNSVEINAAVTTDLLTIDKATIGKLDLQGSVKEVVLKEAIIPEVVLAATKATTLTLQSGNKIAKITNAGTLTLKNAEAAPAVAALSMAIETRAALSNNGAVGEVDNDGAFTDETATIVVVGGKADLTITSLPKNQSTTGESATLAVAAKSANGNVSYKWEKYTTQWEDASGATESLKIDRTASGTTKYRCEVKSTKEGATTTLYTPDVTVQFYTNTPDEPSTPSTPTYTVSLDKVTGATFSKGETTTVDEGDNFSFKITLDKDYDQSKPVVTVDGKAITADADGNYTIKNIQKDIKIIVSGIVKNTATGIEENVADAARAWTVGSTLYIHVPETSDVYVISGTGALQQQLRGVSGDYNMQLRAGFYIVRIGNVSQKVIIR